MFTQDGKRLYSTCRLRDWSGAVDVDLVSEAMLQMYGKSSHEEVVEALADQSLTVKLTRVICVRCGYVSEVRCCMTQA